MATDDFDTRFHKIHTLFHSFHKNFIQENTKNEKELSAINKVKTDIQYIHDALMRFLNKCLHEDETCDTAKRSVEVLVDAEVDGVPTTKVDAKLTKELHDLLTNLCPLMFPWDPNMNAKVGGLFTRFSEHPFSPVSLDVAKTDQITH